MPDTGPERKRLPITVVLKSGARFSTINNLNFAHVPGKGLCARLANLDGGRLKLHDLRVIDIAHIEPPNS